VWTLTTERERGEERLRIRNQELHRINTGLRSLVAASEEFSGCLDVGQLLTSAVVQVESIAGNARAAAYMSDGDELLLCEQPGLPPGFGSHRRRQLVPRAWLGEEGFQGESAPVLREPLDEEESDLFAVKGCPAPRSLTHVALRSPHGLLGMLSITSPEIEASDQHEARMLQILGHQLGVALENARLFANLQYERNLLSGILASMTEGVLVVDHEENVLLTNGAAARLLQVRDGESLPSWFLDQMKAHQTQSPDSGDFLLAEVDGRIIRLSAADLSRNGDVPASTIYVARDVTEEAQAQRMKSDFVAYASHELRTPLTTMKMLVGLLLMEIPSDTKHHEYLTVINTQVERQTRLINNLLDLARLEAGRYEVPPEEVDPREIVESVVKVCRPLAEEKNQAVDVTCSVAPYSIVSNSSGLEQVLTNLVSNAIKFTGQGGRVEISCRENGEEVLFSVKDSGIGMTPEEQQRIFTKFYTVRNPLKRGEGTGIGLALSDLIVEKLGGRIEVTSEVGVGSCFVVHLPMTSHAAQQLQAEREISRAP
jgi:signal transduction histidine kinase